MSDAIYSEFVRRRNSKQIDPDRIHFDLLHCALGIAGEAGEFVDAIKKPIIYGRELDIVNCDEEIGDLLWFIQLYCNHRGKSMQELIDQNMRKLMIRYPDPEFDAFLEANRDPEAERKALEDNG